MYVRPELTLPVFVDASGEPIPYGERWPQDPPEDAYSVTSNVERFAPLHVVADALVADLVDTYDAAVTELPVPVARTTSELPVTVRTVRVTPNDPAASPLTFAFTSFPGVVVHAGAGFAEAYPSCGCDACDEDVIGCVAQLEEAIEAVVAGGLTERFGVDGAGTYQNQLRCASGSRGSFSPVGVDRRPEHTAGDPEALVGGRAWAPWPKRA